MKWQKHTPALQSVVLASAQVWKIMQTALRRESFSSQNNKKTIDAQCCSQLSASTCVLSCFREQRKKTFLLFSLLSLLLEFSAGCDAALLLSGDYLKRGKGNWVSEKMWSARRFLATHKESSALQVLSWRLFEVADFRSLAFRRGNEWHR